MQHCWPTTTNIVGSCCVSLYVAKSLRNNIQQHATGCTKRTQQVTSNKVGSCWPTMLRPFARGFSFRRKTCAASAMQRFLFPVSTVSARNAWNNDLPYERLWVPLLTQVRLIIAAGFKPVEKVDIYWTNRISFTKLLNDPNLYFELTTKTNLLSCGKRLSCLWILSFEAFIGLGVFIFQDFPKLSRLSTAITFY